MIFRNNTSNNQGPVALIDNRNVNIEISYDNFDTVGLDQNRKRQYADDLRRQIEENELKKRQAAEKKKLDDLEEERRLQREREEIERRQKEEEDRLKSKIKIPKYEPAKIEVLKQPIRRRTPIQTEPVQINERYNINNNYVNEDLLNYLKSRETQIDEFSNRVLEQMKLLNRDFDNNIRNLRGEIGALTDLHNRNQKYKDQLCNEVNQIKENLNFKKLQDDKDTRNIYDLVYVTDYTKQMIGKKMYIEPLPRRKFAIKSYVNKRKENDDDFFEQKVTEDNESGNKNKLAYINLNHCVSYSAPRWRPNESVWWYY